MSLENKSIALEIDTFFKKSQKKEGKSEVAAYL